jgi:hypothetical protein
MVLRTKTRSMIVNAVGWFGVIAILLAYTLLNVSVIEVHDHAYQLLNLAGALGILCSSLYDKDYQPAVLNLIWAIIAVGGLFRLL